MIKTPTTVYAKIVYGTFSKYAFLSLWICNAVKLFERFNVMFMSNFLRRLVHEYHLLYITVYYFVHVYVCCWKFVRGTYIIFKPYLWTYKKTTIRHKKKTKKIRKRNMIFSYVHSQFYKRCFIFDELQAS